MNAFKIHNLVDDLNPDGAMTKKYIDDKDKIYTDNINKLKTYVNNEFIQTQGHIDLKADKSNVDGNIKNVNTKITNVVLKIIKTEEKNKKNMLMNHILLVVLI